MQVKRSLAVAAMLVTVAASTAAGAVKTREIEYKQEGTSTPLKGMIAWDDAKTGKQPGILVVHEWWGLNDYARTSARRLAEAGYVAFAVDMFGSGKSTEHRHDAEAMMNAAMKDPQAIIQRFNAAMSQLEQDPHVDPTRIGAIGYCFGGAVVLNMARAGENLKAVVSFHGILATEHPAEKGMIRARILALAGDSDPFVPAAQVTAFEKEMQAAGAQVRVKVYPHAKHAFTNPDAAKYGMPELEYNADAAKDSWNEMLKLFKETLS